MAKKILMIGDTGILMFAKSFRKNFEKLGYIVDEPQYPVFIEQNFLLKRISYFRKKFKDNFFGKQVQLYIEKAKKFKPDFVFVFNNSRITPEFIEYCKENNLPMYTYLCDSIYFTRKAFAYKSAYTNIYSYEPSDAKVEFRPGQFVKYMPLACDHELYTYNPKREYKQDICFVGNLEKRRMELLEKVAAYCEEHNKKLVVHTMMQLHVGKEWWHCLKVISRRVRYNKKYPHLMKCIINEPIVGKDLVNLYNESRICLNIHVGTDPNLHSGPNPRTFEILGCKAFEIMDKEHLMDFPFKDGEELSVFENEKELINKIDYYLTHDNEREAIAEKGYNRVLEVMTIEKQIKKICDDIEKDIK